jgi:hypothetical protein
MGKKNIFFISETAPVNTHASSVIFYRHLLMLELSGYSVTWVTDQNSYARVKNSISKSWNIILLPNRSWFLPPYFPNGIFQSYRFHFYYWFYLKKLLRSAGPGIIMSHISGQFLAPFAAFASKECEIPLVSFFHDDIVELNYYKNRESLINNTKKILGKSEMVFVVSEEFKTNWRQYQHKFKLLYPIPEKYVNGAGTVFPKNKKVTLGYSGALYDEIIPCLTYLADMSGKLDYKLIIIGDPVKTHQLHKTYPQTVDCFPLFETPLKANEFLIANCDAVLIPYPDDSRKMPWITTCFPSKFLQYCQLNLPTIIFAPIDSAIGKWCKRNKWLLYSSNYSSNSLHTFINNINSPDIKESVNSLKIAEFDPDKIQNQLELYLSEILNY